MERRNDHYCHPRLCSSNSRSNGQVEQALFTEREHEELKRLFPMCEKISIDYAVMEQAENIFVVPAEFGWSDLGSWGALHTLLPQDHNGNAK